MHAGKLILAQLTEGSSLDLERTAYVRDVGVAGCLNRDAARAGHAAVMAIAETFAADIARTNFGP
jgi:hypothetical protein